MLELNKVSKTFNPGTVNEKKALDGLSVTLAEGDFVTIVGSNGAGKSTFFNAVAGDFFVDEGSIRLDGADITYLPAYRRSRPLPALFRQVTPYSFFFPSFRQALPCCPGMFHLPVRFLSGSRPFFVFQHSPPCPGQGGKYMKKPVHVSVNRA